MKLLIFFLKRKAAPLTIILLSLLLVIIWFSQKNILGTGESGLTFYNPQLLYENFKTSWANYALGHPTNITIASKPTYFLLGQLQLLGIPTFIIQAGFFWIILIVSAFSIYFITKTLFPSLSSKFLLISVLFYWFNPFSLVNIWNRFLNNFFVFYALLPLLLLLFIRGLKERKYIYVVFIGITSALFSYALTSIAFVFLLWLVFVYTVCFFIFFINKEKRIFTIKFFFVTIFIWGFMNLWWISQVFSYLDLGGFATVTARSFKPDSNYSTFTILSESLGKLTFLFRLKHASFFENNEQLKWVSIYQFPLITFLEFIIISFIFIPIIIKRKNIYVLLLTGLFILTVFFTKGNNPPFGEIFDKAFLNFSYLQLFRNPLEKIGFLLPLAAAPLFALGVSLLINLLSNKWRKFGYGMILCWLCLIWGFPFWNSSVFTSTDVSISKQNVGYQVDVPDYYKEASSWLNSLDKNFRLIVFPLGKEGITYIWPKGYSGVELSNQLLSKAAVSFNTNIPFYDEISNEVEKIFLTRENYPKIMSVLNSKYIMLREDIDWKIRGMRDPHSIYEKLNELESSGTIRKANQLDKLSFWEYTDWKDHALYATKNLVRVKGKPTLEDILNINTDQEVVLHSGEEGIDSKQLITSEIIHPTYKFSLGSRKGTYNFSIPETSIFPTIKFLPSDFLYQAILIKERMELILIKDQKVRFLKKLSLLGKRLIETEKEIERNNIKAAEKSLKGYENELRELVPINSLDVDLMHKEGPLLIEELYNVFLKHLEHIDKIKSDFPSGEKYKIEFLETTLKNRLIDVGILPYFGYSESSEFPIQRRLAYQFDVNQSGTYELLFDSKILNSYYKIFPAQPLLLLYDQDFTSRVGILKENNLVSFGFFNFEKGKHEIALNTPLEINLVNVASEFILNVDHGVVEKSFPINNFNPNSTYFLSLNYQIKKGSGVEVSIEQNNDRFEKGIIKPQFVKNLTPDNYDFISKNFSAYFSPSKTADNATLVFKVKPWNNCQEIYWNRGKEKCLMEDFRRPYDRTTEVVISDVSLVKVLTEEPILRREGNFNTSNTPSLINFKKINESEYRVNVNNANEPYVLVLSELFDPGWKIYINDGKNTGEHFLANTFANGWIINKNGSYELTVKYLPQDLLHYSEKISFATVLLGILVIGWNKWRKKKYEE